MTQTKENNKGLGILGRENNRESERARTSLMDNNNDRWYGNKRKQIRSQKYTQKKNGNKNKQERICMRKKTDDEIEE